MRSYCRCSWGTSACQRHTYKTTYTWIHSSVLRMYTILQHIVHPETRYLHPHHNYTDRHHPALPCGKHCIYNVCMTMSTYLAAHFHCFYFSTQQRCLALHWTRRKRGHSGSYLHIVKHAIYVHSSMSRFRKVPIIPTYLRIHIHIQYITTYIPTMNS